MNYRLLLLILVATLGGACGGDDDSGGGGANIPLADLPTTMGNEYCAKVFSCCTTAEIPMYFEGASITTEEECRAFYVNVFNSLLPRYQASIDAGKMTYNGTAVGSCINVLRGISCTAFASEQDVLDDECGDPWVGMVANDAACASDEECVSNYCEGDSQFGTPMPGVCKPIPGSGQACTDFECANGFYCDNNEMCAAVKADGMSCFSGDECSSGACNGAGDATPGTCGVSAICNGL